MCDTCLDETTPARKRRGFSLPGDELAKLQAAPGSKILSRRLYADRDGFAAFIEQRGAAIMSAVRRVLQEFSDAGKRAGSIRSWDRLGQIIDGAMLCRICRMAKPVADFTTIHGKPITKCKPCEAERTRRARLANVERYAALRRRRYWADIGKSRRQNREWARTERGRETNCEAVGRYKKRHPERVSAQRKLQTAIKRGAIQRPDVCQIAGCDCAGRLHAHHSDYAKPLDAIFVCHEHHEYLHHVGKLRLKQRVGRYAYAFAPAETFRPRRITISA